MKIDAATRIALVKKLEELAPYVGAADYFDRLREAVSGLRGEHDEPLKTSVGNIVLLGMWHNGQARVQFNDLEGNLFPSDWNEYLFKIAKDAYLGNRRLGVLSVGDPVGPNILIASLVQGI